MVDHDFETLAISLYGNQSKSIDDGIYTLYDLSGQNNIYAQYDLYEVRDQFNDQLYEVRQNRGNNIDFNKSIFILKFYPIFKACQLIFTRRVIFYT